MDNFAELTDDEDLLELINVLMAPRAPRTFRERHKYFVKWNDNEFRARFRLSKATVRIVVDEIRVDISCIRHFNSAVTPEEMVLITLCYLATGSILQIMGDFCGIDKSTASRIISKVIRSIARLANEIIKMPSNEIKVDKVKNGFFEMARFPKCIGALDCTHVRIISPGGEDPEIFSNRKGFFSFNVQAVCDHKLQVQDIVCRWPGSSHDSTIFNNSRLRGRIENGEFGLDSVLVGDGGYTIKKYLITPLLNPRTRKEHLFNESQIRTRNPVERCFEVIKKRFPVLALGIRLHVSKVEVIVVSCAVLHNIACQTGEPEPEVNLEIAEAIRETMNINLNTYPDNIPDHFNFNSLKRYNLINTYFRNLR